MQALKTTYKDDIMSSSQRKYAQTNNADGTISLTDKTVYTQTGDTFGANDINAITKNINQINNVREVKLTAAGWSGSSAPYTQTVPVSDMRADDNPIIVSMLADNASAATQNAYAKAFSRITAGSATTAAGSVTFRVYKKPATDITVGLKGVM